MLKEFQHGDAFNSFGRSVNSSKILYFLMCYFDVILLSDVISSIGPKISDADTFILYKCLLYCKMHAQI